MSHARVYRFDDLSIACYGAVLNVDRDIVVNIVVHVLEDVGKYLQHFAQKLLLLKYKREMCSGIEVEMQEFIVFFDLPLMVP